MEDHEGECICGDDNRLFEAALETPLMQECICEAVMMEIVEDADNPKIKYILTRHDGSCPLSGPVDAFTKSVAESRKPDRVKRVAKGYRTSQNEVTIVKGVE